MGSPKVSGPKICTLQSENWIFSFGTELHQKWLLQSISTLIRPSLNIISTDILVTCPKVGNYFAFFQWIVLSLAAESCIHLQAVSGELFTSELFVQKLEIRSIHWSSASTVFLYKGRSPTFKTFHQHRNSVLAIVEWSPTSLFEFAFWTILTVRNGPKVHVRRVWMWTKSARVEVTWA